MARPVYSVQLLSSQGLNGAGPSVTVPVGFTYVVKQLTFYADPFLGPVRGFFRHVDTGASFFACATNAGVPGWFGFYGALVFEEGETFRWETSAFGTDGADVSAHGYRLASA